MSYPVMKRKKARNESYLEMLDWRWDVLALHNYVIFFANCMVFVLGAFADEPGWPPAARVELGKFYSAVCLPGL